MVRVHRSPVARADILDALGFSLETWGVEQAVNYADLIDEGVEAIRENPHIGRPRFGVRPGILAHHIGQKGRRASHFLYYRIDLNGDVEIVRLLHERMDPGLHL